jgi:hypothetical protein
LSEIGQQPQWVQWAYAGMIIAAPIGMAGLIFSFLFSAASGNGSAAFAFNLFGAMCGGVIEYTSMIFGISAMGILAAILYTLAFVSYNRSCQAVTG